jgi:hypothetical protein
VGQILLSDYSQFSLINVGETPTNKNKRRNYNGKRNLYTYGVGTYSRRSLYRGARNKEKSSKSIRG